MTGGQTYRKKDIKFVKTAFHTIPFGNKNIKNTQKKQFFKQTCM